MSSDQKRSSDEVNPFAGTGKKILPGAPARVRIKLDPPTMANPRRSDAHSLHLHRINNLLIHQGDGIEPAKEVVSRASHRNYGIPLLFLLKHNT
jgi:hypothetical protein